MALSNKIRELLANEKAKKEKEKIDQLAEAYKEMVENGEENPIDTTVERIMEIIKESDNPNESAEKMIQATLEAEPMPNRITEKLSVKISNSDKIPDNVITHAIENTDINVPDEMITTIINEGKIAQDERLKLMKNIDDEDIIRDKIRNEFNILYKICKDKRDDEVVNSILKFKKFLEDNNVDMDTAKLEEQIIAKKMADNIYHDMKKGTRIYVFTKVIPTRKMFERNLADKVEEEYLKLEDEGGKKEGRFKKEDLDMQILVQLAKEIGYNYRENKKFLIPKSEKLRNISPEKEQIFISKITSTSGKERLTEEELLEIEKGIKGIIDNENTKEMMLVETIKQRNE